MKVVRYDTGPVFVELSRRNLEVLLAKLDDPNSARTISQEDGHGSVYVKAVENDEHYADREPGPMLVNGRLT